MQPTRLICINRSIGSFCKKMFQRKFQEGVRKRIVDNARGKYEVVDPWVVSGRRRVPDYIPKPPYAQSAIPQAAPEIPEIKDKNQIECMRGSCYLAQRVLNYARTQIKAGTTTDELDGIIHETIINNGAYPSPLNYRGFPKSICTSVNNVACHGIPDGRPLQDGDILNVDITVYLNGYHGDCSAMFTVGEVDAEAKRLIQVTDMCLEKAIQICKPNENFSSIGKVVEDTANAAGYNVVPEFVGHGIGSYFHGPPDILHFENCGSGKMQAGMTFTIEPILSQGGPDIEILKDGWTAVTVDQARTAQTEHTILITASGCEVLTR